MKDVSKYLMHFIKSIAPTSKGKNEKKKKQKTETNKLSKNRIHLCLDELIAY